MTLKGEKTAWLVILACSAAIAVLLILSSGNKKRQQVKIPSSPSRVPASLPRPTTSNGSRVSPGTTEIKDRSFAKGRAQNSSIIKAKVTMDPQPRVGETSAATQGTIATEATQTSSEAKIYENENDKKAMRRRAIAFKRKMLDVRIISYVRPPIESGLSQETPPPPALEEELPPQLDVKVLYTAATVRRIRNVQALTNAVFADLARIGNVGEYARISYEEVSKPQIRDVNAIKSMFTADYFYVVTERGGIMLLSE